MDVSEKLKPVIANAMSKGLDLDATIEEASKLVRALKDSDIDTFLWNRGLAEQVYDFRHLSNVQLKAGTNLTASNPKVIAGRSSTAESVGLALAEYNYFISGRTLGDLQGSELLGLAESEESVAAGHVFNATLLRRLKPLVADNKTVRQAVKARKLKQMFVELQAGGGNKLAG